MKTKVVVKRYAIVEHGVWDYRVYENGDVERWDDDIGWREYYGDEYGKVQVAGLAALKEHTP